jgi:hypothetical protein
MFYRPCIFVFKNTLNLMAEALNQIRDLLISRQRWNQSEVAGQFLLTLFSHLDSTNFKFLKHLISVSFYYFHVLISFSKIHFHIVPQKSPLYLLCYCFFQNSVYCYFEILLLCISMQDLVWLSEQLKLLLHHTNYRMTPSLW